MIPFLDLKAQYAGIRAELDEAVLRVLGSGRYILGEEVAAFEREFAAYCGTKHAIAVNTGTSALHLSLLAEGVGPGHEVALEGDATACRMIKLRGKEQPLPGQRPTIIGLPLGEHLVADDVDDPHAQQLAAGNLEPFGKGLVGETEAKIGINDSDHHRQDVREG